MAKSDPLDTPMMRQYLATKREHPDCMLFMRMGDFYEVFLDDAEEAARILGITLTSRNKDDPNPVAMAGVPHHALAQHMPKLLAAGKRVAIMDQLEDPKASKGLVKRGLSRIISAGTCIEDDLLEARSERLLVAITALQGPCAVAACDIAGGTVWVEACADTPALMSALARWQPAELLLPQALFERDDRDMQLTQLWDGMQPPPCAGLAGSTWNPDEAWRWLCQELQVATLAGMGIADDERQLAAAAAAAVRYARNNAGDHLQHLRRLRRLRGDDYLILDGHCQRNLELVRNQRDGGRAHTLLATVDRCRTAPGSRLLARWLVRPLADTAPLMQRHEAVAFLLAEADLRARLRHDLDAVYDLERLVGRIASGRANARDLIQLASSLHAARAISERFSQHQQPQLIADMLPCLEDSDGLAQRISQQLVDHPPLSINEGGMIRDGIDTELDDLRRIRSGAGDWLAQYQHQQAQALGLKSLKVGYNKVFGYFIELGKQHADHVPDSYTRKQTLVNAERYITPELKDYEDQVLGAEDRIRTRERLLFDQLRDAIMTRLDDLQASADALSHLDVVAALAEVAQREGWCRPQLDPSTAIHLEQARHPVVEAVLGPGRFIANDCHLDADREHETPSLLVLTGPNMAGKSTYIRQVALAVILAQAGSFVPASKAHIGIVDRLFTRIGAGDELARNMSTFMVEMAETAAILNNATQRSLVILDEVGRGTSTFDGLSLAWAITEYLHDQLGCRCLFATHYHELTELAGERSGIHNCTVQVAEQDDDVIFMHRIIDGAATKSYGIHVARLAGVPDSVIARARHVLANLDDLNLCLGERERPSAAPATASSDGDSPMQLSIFASEPSPLLRELAALDSNDLSPRQAWDTIDALIAQARKECR
ncbi:MAG: DNA mismatch repair protein MutS [Planctomycetota bacterium]|nr:MAG: DNA mismatch repair protein MutS [Planctomycetota bacterium]